MVGRLVAEWPLASKSRALRIAGELAYAPETPTSQALELPGSGDADGMAWNIVVSLMNLYPDHDIGINYGVIDPGWLLSPDFTDNEEQIELRYRWKMHKRFSSELRVRQRKDDVKKVSAQRKRDRFDAFLRLTWKF